MQKTIAGGDGVEDHQLTLPMAETGHRGRRHEVNGRGRVERFTGTRFAT